MGCWKSILVGFECFNSLVHVKVKSGSKVLFWHDVWCRDQSLKIQFPELFTVTLLKEVMVHDVVSWNGDQSHWNITFFRTPKDCEGESVYNFFASLVKVKVLLEGIDETIRPYDCNNSIQSFCHKLCSGGNCPNFLV